MVQKIQGGPSIPSSPAGEQEQKVTVRQGDTLSKIASQHDVSEKELLNANPQIKDPKKLSPGQELTIPEKASQTGRAADAGTAASAGGAAGAAAGGAAAGSAAAKGAASAGAAAGGAAAGAGAASGAGGAAAAGAKDAVGRAAGPGALLQTGSTGAQVRNLQNDLNEWRAQNGRPPIDVNGRFTNGTKEAVQDFQRANGLKDDGIVGIRTRTRLALENNANFRQLNDATKTQVREQMTRYDGDATKLQNLSQLATSDGFRQLNVDHQRQMLTALDGRAGDRKFGGELTALANSATFRALNDAEKTQMINNISTHGSAAAFVGSLNNDQLLALAESPSGPNQLAALREAMQSGGVDRAERAQLERISSATFTPGVGLNVNGSAADQATYLHMVRREMLTSPTFRNVMNTQNADRAHPLTINVGRNQGGVQIDRFRDQTIDLTDYEQFPETPPAGNPDATTRGQNLVHFMAEARQGVLGNNFDRSHARGIQAENQYRAEIGQRSRLTSSPFDAAGNIEMRYSNGYRETIQFGGGDGVTGIDRRNP